MYPIPANATRIRYLESTGTQWINAGVTPDGNTAIDSVWTIPSTSSGTLCGGRTSGSEGQFYVWARPGHTNPNQAWRFGYGTVNAYFGPASAYTTPMRVSFGHGYAKFGSAEEAFSSQTFTGTRFYIFALCNGASSSSDKTPLKLHWLKIWQSDVLVRSFVPVRVGSTGYLFDRVSGTLYGNSGTGDFVLGPDTFQQGVLPTRMMVGGGRKKLPYDAEVEYLESTGTQYIDTGYCSCEHSHVVIDTTFQSSAGSSCFFGTRTSNMGTGSTENFTLSAFVNGSGNCAINDYKYDSGWLTNKPALVAGGRYRIEILNRSLYVNNTLYVASPTTASYTSNVSLGIFRLKQRDGFQTETNRPLVGRIWSFRVDEGGILFRDMIPVRVGSVGYLYDKVTKTLFGNAGTGSFVLGPDK